MEDYNTIIDTKDYVISLERAIGAKRGEIVGKLILYVRAGKRLTEVDNFAAALGVTRTTIYNWLQDYSQFLDKEKGGDTEK